MNVNLYGKPRNVHQVRNTVTLGVEFVDFRVRAWHAGWGYGGGGVCSQGLYLAIAKTHISAETSFTSCSRWLSNGNKK